MRHSGQPIQGYSNLLIRKRSASSTNSLLGLFSSLHRWNSKDIKQKKIHRNNYCALHPCKLEKKFIAKHAITKSIINEASKKKANWFLHNTVSPSNILTTLYQFLCLCYKTELNFLKILFWGGSQFMLRISSMYFISPLCVSVNVSSTLAPPASTAHFTAP